MKVGDKVKVRLFEGAEWLRAFVYVYDYPWIQFRKGEALYGANINDIEVEKI